MMDMPAVVMIAPPAASLCCVAGTPSRRKRGVWIPASVMLAAMVTSSIPHLPGIILVLAAVAVVATVPVAVARPAEKISASSMQIHRALSAILMAGILLAQVATRDLASAGAMTRRPAESGMASMSHMDSPVGSRGVMAIAVILVVGYLVFSAGMVVHVIRFRPSTLKIDHTPARIFGIGELVSMSGLIVLMAAML